MSDHHHPGDPANNRPEYTLLLCLPSVGSLMDTRCMVVYPALARSEYTPDFGAGTFLGDVSEEWSNSLSEEDRTALDIVNETPSSYDGGEEENLYEYMNAGIDPNNLELLSWSRVESLMNEQGLDV